MGEWGERLGRKGEETGWVVKHDENKNHQKEFHQLGSISFPEVYLESPQVYPTNSQLIGIKQTHKLSELQPSHMQKAHATSVLTLLQGPTKMQTSKTGGGGIFIFFLFNILIYS